MQAFVELKTSTLGMILEHGSESLQMKASLLFAKACIQMAQLRDGFEQDSQTSTFDQAKVAEAQQFDFYKRKMLQQAETQLKIAL